MNVVTPISVCCSIKYDPSSQDICWQLWIRVFLRGQGARKYFTPMIWVSWSAWQDATSLSQSTAPFHRVCPPVLFLYKVFPCFNFLLKTNHIHVFWSLPGGMSSKVMRWTSIFYCFRPQRARKLSFQAASVSAGDESCSCEEGTSREERPKYLDCEHFVCTSAGDKHRAGERNAKQAFWSQIWWRMVVRPLGGLLRPREGKNCGWALQRTASPI